MDETSIITQVQKEECQQLNSNANGNHVPVLNEKDIQPPHKKRHNRGFLSIFCCFGGPSSSKSLHQKSAEGAQTTINTTAAVLPPNNNQNTLTKGYEEDEKEEEIDSALMGNILDGLIGNIFSLRRFRENTKQWRHNLMRIEWDRKQLAKASTQESFYLLPAICHQDLNKKCVVIDLDETLVHSSFKPVDNPDFIVPVEIDGTVHQVYVLKRPYVDMFLKRMGEIFECVLFTASLAKYADPVADLLDKTTCFRSRLFRESCVFYKGNYVKDLSKLGRDLHNVVIIDNSPASYIFHPENAVPVTSWFDDRDDTELMDMIPFLESISSADNCITALQNNYSRYRAGLRLSGMNGGEG